MSAVAGHLVELTYLRAIPKTPKNLEKSKETRNPPKCLKNKDCDKGDLIWPKLFETRIDPLKKKKMRENFDHSNETSNVRYVLISEES